MFRDRLWTYALVTGVSILIWFWAAAETRDRDSASFRLQLKPARPTEQIVAPREIPTAVVEMEGSKLALERARKLASGPALQLTVGNELPSFSDPAADLAQVLEKNKELRDTGVSVVAVAPASFQLEVDALVPVSASVRHDLPGVETEGDVIVEPAQVVVHLPSRHLPSDDLTVLAHVPQTRLERLEPGVQTTIEDVRLRLPPQFANVKSVTIEPPEVNVTFTVLSRIKEITLPTVWVQIASPAEDHQEYIVEIEDRSLNDVTIKATGDLVEKIRRNDSSVIALVHLSHKEKERGIQSKPVTCFMAIPRDGGPGTIVEAEVAGSTTPPVIRLKISQRSVG